MGGAAGGPQVTPGQERQARQWSPADLGPG